MWRKQNHYKQLMLIFHKWNCSVYIFSVGEMQHIHDDSGSDWGSIVSIASFPHQHNNNDQSKYMDN